MSAPPAVLLRWLPTSLGANFGAYRVYRRPSRAASFEWTQVADISVPDGRDPATVEAHHSAWIDYAPGWATDGGPYAEGWDYSVVVYNATTTLRSALRDTDLTRIVVPPASVTWLVCNAAPWLNAPLTKVQKIGAEDLDQVDVYRPIGRDFAVTRGRSELPARQWTVGWRHMGMVGEDPGRYARAARASGRQVTVLTARGDRLEGSLASGQLAQTTEPVTDAEATLVETARHPEVSGFNLPCGVVLDGSSGYATTPDDASLDPGTGPFTIVAAGAPQGSPGVILSKGELDAGDGYGLRAVGGDPELAGFYAALAERHTRRVEIFCIGDSITEGQGATTTAERWVNLLQDRLRAGYPTGGSVTGGVGYLAGYYVSPTLTDPTRIGTLGENFGFGPGFRALELQTGEGVTFSVTGTGIRVWYTGINTVARSIAVSVDGGGATVLSEVTGGSQEEMVADIDLGASGAHTVTITWNAAGGSGFAYVSGIQVFDGDEDSGIQVFEAGHSGYKAGDFTTGTAGDMLADQLALSDPSLMIVEFGTNELFLDTDPAVYGANLQAIVDVARGVNPDLPILLLAIWERDHTGAYPWSDYVAAMQDVVDANTAMALLDMSQLWPRPNTPEADALGYYSDAVHPSPQGHEALAEVIFDTMLAADGIDFTAAGATNTARPSAGPIDPSVHVFAGDSDSTAQRLYIDGVEAAVTAVATGSVANSDALVAGANDGGASQHAAMTLHAWAYYSRVLTADEHEAAANYLLGRPGFRMPSGAEVFFDLRDDRCWDGVDQTLEDLGDGTLTASLVGSPPTRGEPWPLADLDRWS